MWKYFKPLLFKRPRLYRGTTDQMCRSMSPNCRRIRIWGIAWGPFMIAFHVLDLKNYIPRNRWKK